MTIEQLEALERAATADGWKVEITGNSPWPERFDILTLTGAPICVMTCQTDTECTANSAVIAAARNALPALLAVAKAAKALRATDSKGDWCPMTEEAMEDRERFTAELDAALSRLEAQ